MISICKVTSKSIGFQDVICGYFYNKAELEICGPEWGKIDGARGLVKAGSAQRCIPMGRGRTTFFLCEIETGWGGLI